MPLNIKDREAERLAAEVAAMTGESKTRAIRTALEERKQRLAMRVVHRDRGQALRRFLVEEVWPQVPSRLRGRRLTRREREAILGYRMGTDLSAVASFGDAHDSQGRLVQLSLEHLTLHLASCAELRPGQAASVVLGLGERWTTSLQAEVTDISNGGPEAPPELRLRFVAPPLEAGRKIVSALEKPYGVAGLDVRVSARVGYMVDVQRDADLDDLVERAATALTRAKQEAVPVAGDMASGWNSAA